MTEKLTFGGFGLAGRLGFCANASDPRRKDRAKILVRSFFKNWMFNMVVGLWVKMVDKEMF